MVERRASSWLLLSMRCGAGSSHAELDALLTSALNHLATLVGGSEATVNSFYTRARLDIMRSLTQWLRTAYSGRLSLESSFENRRCCRKRSKAGSAFSSGSSQALPSTALSSQSNA